MTLTAHTGLDAVPGAAGLAVEFQRLARYLIGATATSYQIETYIAVHRRHPLAAKSGFDRLLLTLARSSGLGLALADAYSGFFARQATLRAKLVTALAVLECSAPSFRTIDAPDPPGPLAWPAVALHGAAAVVALACATLILLPAQIALGRAR